MFKLVPYSKRRDDVFTHFARSLNKAFEDEFFAPFQNASQPIRTDIRETDKSYVIEAELPGFDKEDITIDYAEPILAIKAVRKDESGEENENRQVIRRERRYGEYVRRFYAENVEKGGITASLRNGILSLELPKKEKPQASRIEIQDGEV